MKVGAIVQARMESSRLPGKVLFPNPDGRPLLGMMLARLQFSRTIRHCILAIPDTRDNDILAAWAHQWHKMYSCDSCFRGETEDVLSRIYNAASEADLDIIVRLTADCPLVDPAVVDQCVLEMQARKVGYLRTSANWPDGLDVEVCTMAMLERAHQEATLRSDRQHFGPWMLRQTNAVLEPEFYTPHIRVTVDYPEDYQVVYRVLERLSWRGWHYEMIRQLAHTDPDIWAPNRKYSRNEGYLRDVAREREKEQAG